MSAPKRFAALPVVALLAGCANYLYQGSIQAEDSQGVEREAVLYWSKTDPLIGPPKADTAVLRTACGTPVTYATRPQGIVFIGTPGEDSVVGEADSVTPGRECGRFVDRGALVDVEAGDVRLTIRCEPIADEFSVGRAYLRAREEPYSFPVGVTKEWSLFGRTPEAPVPACE